MEEGGGGEGREKGREISLPYQIVYMAVSFKSCSSFHICISGSTGITGSYCSDVCFRQLSFASSIHTHILCKGDNYEHSHTCEVESQLASCMAGHN